MIGRLKIWLEWRRRRPHPSRYFYPCSECGAEHYHPQAFREAMWRWRHKYEIIRAARKRARR